MIAFSDEVDPVRVKKTRQIKKIESFTVSVKRRKTLASKSSGTGTVCDCQIGANEVNRSSKCIRHNDKRKKHRFVRAAG